MGLSVDNGGGPATLTHKVFLLTNYALIGAASSCAFLTLSLRLIPSLTGALLVLLHAVTIAGAAVSCRFSSEAPDPVLLLAEQGTELFTLDLLLRVGWIF
ncbi:hypothetical protein STAS_04073 [Striga asiatica]|uniref:Uncharacterized protein n=1 Tax=Striga asiatica TaxID=4170 RepID=A0A5A7P693_STRAF|nr:hypothetical protein STAS_04073 [Striga asiatica]